MTGRHASPRETPPSSWPRRLGLAVVVVATLGAAGLGATAIIEPSGGEGCEGTLPVAVAADPGIAPVLSEVAELYAESGSNAQGICVEVDVTPLSTAEAVPVIGTAASADLWVPKSSLFAQEADQEAINHLANVAISPLVVAMPRAVATELGWPEASFSWRAVIEGGQAALADPATNDEGLATLVAVRSALGDTLEQAEIVQLMTAISRATVPDVEAAFAAVTEGGEVGRFTATEQGVVMHNRNSPQTPVSALYPAEGTLAFDYPALAVQRPGADEGVASAVADFVTFLGSVDALHSIRSAGFRAPDGTAADSAGIVDGIQSSMPRLLHEPDPAVVAGLARQWAALTLDMRMLAVIDISGSMNEQVEGGGTRIELTRDAALEAVELFPPSSSVGLWAFSTLRDPPRDHAELLDIGPLDEEHDEGTRMDALVEALKSLPERAQGGTGLYDTTLAAFQKVRGSYEPGKVNSVVLLTDGRNEDDPDGIDLATLLNTLTAQFDPARPVPIITIGMGPEADMDALRQISASTGTTAYQARDPRDIKNVFIQAMIERQCRPNC